MAKRVLEDEDLIEEETCAFTLSNQGWLRCGRSRQYVELRHDMF